MGDRHQSVSACVITYNRASIVGTCLRAVGFADEVILVDKTSTDATRAVAARFVDRIVTVPWSPTVEETRALAVSLCRHDWILLLDDDECLNPEAVGFIRRELAAPRADLYAFPLRHYILGRHDERAYYWPEHHIRLFRRDAMALGGTVHGGMTPRSDRIMRIGIEEGPCIHHLSHPDVSGWIERTNRYTSRPDRVRVSDHAGAATEMGAPAEAAADGIGAGENNGRSVPAPEPFRAMAGEDPPSTTCAGNPGPGETGRDAPTAAAIDGIGAGENNGRSVPAQGPFPVMAGEDPPSTTCGGNPGLVVGDIASTTIRCSATNDTASPGWHPRAREGRDGVALDAGRVMPTGDRSSKPLAAGPSRAGKGVDAALRRHDANAPIDGSVLRSSDPAGSCVAPDGGATTERRLPIQAAQPGKGKQDLAGFAHGRIDHWLALTQDSGADDYLQAVAVLRAVYDIVDRLKTWEEARGQDGAALFRRVCIELDTAHAAARAGADPLRDTDTSPWARVRRLLSRCRPGPRQDFVLMPTSLNADR